MERGTPLSSAASAPPPGGPRPAYRKVVVTGLGATTPLGGDVAATWEALLRGTSGTRLLDEPWAQEVPVPLGAPALVDPKPGLTHIQRRRLSRGSQLAVTAAAEAWRDAGLEGAELPPARVGVAVSTAFGDVPVLLDSWEMLKEKGARRIHPLGVSMHMGNAPAAAVGLLVHARAGVHATVNACSSGTQALALAADTIRLGRADVVVAGGAEAPLHPLVLGGFAAMRVLSTRVGEPAAASRPFDADRDGMVLAEGAGILVLEAEEHARARGARCYAELAGVGISSDAHHTVQPEPHGEGNVLALRDALAEAGAAPGQVAYVNANGTATGPGDTAEAHALRAVFGAEGGPAVSAHKSMLGHSIGAAGAVESVATVLSVHHGLVPPTPHFERADEGAALDIVRGAPRKLAGGEILAVKNSAGFGGHNVALVFRTAHDGPAPATRAG
ncbi:beta-ketoacyl-[acyl-carrier-protein] synthase family protein [Streptomyces hoynatensis]|uniref:Beta-ketoacyl-[acyl-carrier-protein] synthase family protein n=1 Tax=Streptomyces hoynatensis TaxID=1141874 RepID=A0A3A9YWC0_9ACTN|nr:beta-ketoacyl-[acyl-carrier-protein] synthase family protein [Streptomyces hoynatensis]RKN40381.1 beta-ketoacyl-[acyl-carrier-protein] synthase family protein [Streptomyces hoynatensis]